MNAFRKNKKSSSAIWKSLLIQSTLDFLKPQTKEAYIKYVGGEGGEGSGGFYKFFKKKKKNS